MSVIKIANVSKLQSFAPGNDQYQEILIGDICASIGARYHDLNLYEPVTTGENLDPDKTSGNQ